MHAYGPDTLNGYLPTLAAFVSAEFMAFVGCGVRNIESIQARHAGLHLLTKLVFGVILRRDS